MMIPLKQGNGLHRLIYVSSATATGMDASALALDIAAESGLNNARKALTGALLARGSWFVQALEGSPDSIAELYARIAEDPRHHDLRIVSFQPIAARAFPKWAMLGCKLEKSDVDAHLHPLTLSAEALLGLLKLAARRFRVTSAA